MGSRPEGTNTVEVDTQGAVQSTITSHPWWRGPGFGTNVVPDAATKASVGQSQLHGSVGEGGDTASKEMQSIGNGSGYSLLRSLSICPLCMCTLLCRMF